MTKVALVFRTIGERTSDLSLELARENIRPDEVHVLENTRPFTQTVQRMLDIDYASDFVVAVDADCLIYQDLRPFLDRNREPYVDCYVHDRFRGRIHCGVHITRADVMRKMRELPPPAGDEAYVLRPESRRRKLALNALGHQKCYKSFRIYHDHFQWLRDVWAKYALRELRSRTVEQRRGLEAALVRWRESPVVELRVAEAAVRWAANEVPLGTPADVLARTIASLQEVAPRALVQMGFEERGPLTRDEVDAFVAEHVREVPPFRSKHRVFGLGLSRTGTRSLTAALHVLGIDTVHYPIDDDSLRAMTSGRLDFGLLETFDGLTDITVSPYYAQLERQHPDAKFVLTLRDKQSWLRSCEAHWGKRDPWQVPRSEAESTHMKVRRFLRAAVYGCYDFDAERFSLVYDQHVAHVRDYFRDKPGKLLELDIVGGHGWDELCAFLDRPRPVQPFPHKGGVMSARADDEVGDPDD